MDKHDTYIYSILFFFMVNSYEKDNLLYFKINICRIASYLVEYTAIDVSHIDV